MIMIPSVSPDVDLEASVARFFGPETPLRRAPECGGQAYEARPQQAHMALAIAQALARGEHLCVEAPTGVGKSFAYLVPAVLLARQRQRPVVISTHTIALQEQLLNKDIPLLLKLLDIPFRAALAKGRENYVCRGRLEKVRDHGQEYLPAVDLIPEIQRIAEWSTKTTDGSLSDLPFSPSPATWAAVCSDPGTCTFSCALRAEHCFFQNARRRLFGADIVVANHALFAIDLALKRDTDGQQGILPDYASAIIDEAHTFEDVAATHLGIRVSTYGVMLMLERLYNSRTQHGLLARRSAAAARQAAIHATEVATRFFARLREWVQQQHENPLTYSTPGHIPNLLTGAWAELDAALGDALTNGDADDEYEAELSNVRARLKDYHDKIDCFLEMRLEDCVYWFERVGRTQRHITFNAVPVEVNHSLRPLLFEREFPVVMTSATLAVRQDLSYFKCRVGAEEATSLVLDSPFDFRHQVDLYLAYDSMPSPKDRDAFVPAACEQIKQFIIKTNGKAFVLFTNHSVMQEAAALLEEFFAANKIRLLVQGRDLQRTQMLDLFREDINSVIFGADSFWMGVDVPGEALSNVIIVKLPFPVPSHPLIAARRQRLESQGHNSFQDYFLPEAILKFRQGIGRLIRNRQDHGIIVVLDPRILKTRYGNAFLTSIPDCRRFLF